MKNSDSNVRVQQTWNYTCGYATHPGRPILAYTSRESRLVVGDTKNSGFFYSSRQGSGRIPDSEAGLCGVGV